jgi:hypothetical protein
LSDTFSAKGVITRRVNRIDQCNTAYRTNEVLVNSANVCKGPKVDALRNTMR